MGTYILFGPRKYTTYNGPDNINCNNFIKNYLVHA